MLLPKIPGFHRDFRFAFAYPLFHVLSGRAPTANHRGMVYLGACLIAGIRLAREKQVNVGVIPISTAVDESVEFAHDIYCRVFRKSPKPMEKVH